MIERYAQPEMKALFHPSKKVELFLLVECAIIQAKEKAGLVPKGIARKIQRKVSLDLSRIEEIEKELRHDVLSFVKHVNEQIGQDSAYFHAGVTSYDIVDTALSLQLKTGCSLLSTRIRKLLTILRRLGQKHRDTLMIGRTHGIYAEPISFGQKLALFFAEWERNLQRLEQAKAEIAVGKISGAVGNYAHLSPKIERAALVLLRLKPVPVSSQILQRDRHAVLLCTLAILAGSCEKMALEIRLLQRSECAEVEEPFQEGQRGSSAMPHKRNPFISERIESLARYLRGLSQVSLENIALWHERDLTNSANERFLFSHAFILLDYMLKALTEVYTGLHVKRDKMQENLEHALGLYASQNLLLKLMEKGWGREKAYPFVQQLCFEAMQQRKNLSDLLLQKKEIKSVLSLEEIEELFSLEKYTEHLAVIYRRVGWKDKQK